MKQVIFLPSEKSSEPDGMQDILQLARAAGLNLQSTCGGKKLCGKCKVVVEKTAGPLPPATIHEKEILGETLILKGYRLACETVLSHDSVILIPEESRDRPQILLTSGTDYLYPACLQPCVESYYVEVAEPTIDSPTADRERLILALSKIYGLNRLSADLSVLRKLPVILRSDMKGVTVTIRDKKDIIDLCEGRQERLFGMAFDIGTTTIVGYLMDLSTGELLSSTADINPQIPFGGDVISRISYCREEPQGLDKLRSKMIECLNHLVTSCASQAGIDQRKIMDMTVVGNTVMHHLFLGLDPTYLSLAPYPPALSEAQDVKARDLGIQIGDSVYLHLLPVKAGFVGSDAVAGILATAIHRKKAISLLIDLGTNGEIVLGNRKRLICCSTAAGPAFEGGHIKWGVRAVSGAIERVSIDPVTFDVVVKTIHNKPAVGICGSGIISAVAEMIRAGIVLEKGDFNEKIRSPRLRKGEDGLEFVLIWASETPIDRDIGITRKDISELQMAKAAVCAGTTLLMEVLEVKHIQRILLAGAFGNYVNPLDARTIGLLPESEGPEPEVVGVGNAAGHGACLALLDKRIRNEAARMADRLAYKELAGTQRFRELFVSSMFFKSACDYQNSY